MNPLNALVFIFTMHFVKYEYRLKRVYFTEFRQPLKLLNSYFILDQYF